MAYQAVSIYTLDGAFLGYGLKQDGVDKLHNNNLWTDSAEDVEDLKAQLGRLNDAVDIRAYWPDVRDEEVQAILNDPEFEPLKLSAVEVVDEENSLFIWIEEPSDTSPGQMDPDASIIAYKFVDAPAPTDVQARIKKACEIVARRRAANG
jgi:hypothetical protein